MGRSGNTCRVGGFLRPRSPVADARRLQEQERILKDARIGQFQLGFDIRYRQVCRSSQCRKKVFLGIRIIDRPPGLDQAVRTAATECPVFHSSEMEFSAAMMLGFRIRVINHSTQPELAHRCLSQQQHGQDRYEPHCSRVHRDVLRFQRTTIFRRHKPERHVQQVAKLLHIDSRHSNQHDRVVHVVVLHIVRIGSFP
jgi:hypothetical protein